MKKRSNGSLRLNCFSPPVMIATMTIEVCLAIYTAWRYKLNELGKLMVTTLVFLASFQYAEYNVCTGNLGHDVFWSRFGFAAITTLPPLGLHLVHVLANKPQRKLVYTAYATMAAYVGIYLFMTDAFSGHQCTGNYVIFHLRANLGGSYWLYYFGWIFTSTGLGIKWMRELGTSTKQQIKRRAIAGLVGGWYAFIIPTAVANAINPASLQGIPSIMCGFAVIFALVLVLYVGPRAAIVKNELPDYHDFAKS